MSIEIIRGNIWNTKCNVLVNTVNCQGVMGTGMALEARLRYPEMYNKYREICNLGLLKVGKLYLYQKSEPYWILNFPTKNIWKLPSKEEYIILGLEKFINSYKYKKITSVAFPILGGLNGGLDEDRVLKIMLDHLKDLDIPIEIYYYDKKCSDDFFNNFKYFVLNTDIKKLSQDTKIRISIIENLINELSNNNKSYYQINQLLSIKGVGKGTLEKIFNYSRFLKNKQPTLF